MQPGVDKEVADDVDLFRLVNPDLDIVWDENDGCWLVKSRAFQNTGGSDRMSVVLGDTLAADGRPPEDARRAKPDWFVVALRAGDVRTEAQEVERDPIPAEPAHGNVVGDKKSRSRRRAFASMARWVVEPPPR